MSESSLEQFGLDRPESGDDVAVPFTLENLDSRGRVVRLGNQLDMIIARHGYPEPVARLLGEAVTLAALIGTSLKFEGRFILQSRTDGPVSLLVVDFDTPDGLRAYARYDEEALAALVQAGTTKPQDLLGKGVLALTVDQGVHMDRYQGIVALEGESLEEVAHTYFMQSEQIPTRVRLAVAEHSERGQSRPSWRAGGVLLQHLPEHGGATMPDLPGDGDFDNDDMADPDFVEDDHWTEAKALLDTLTDGELADPDLSAERLLFRLYHETGVRVFEPQPLVERCTCSAERVEQMINDFTPEDREEMVVDGQIEVVCEFCSTHYHFNPNQF
ncbi:Hsp33 family molecular chaperone [Pelagibacterium sp.]|uniref:Hsp33 family molecular chaperone n=1 Tax=Pelagibacterium sp. TaxID=1967288 RepID=UPI003C79D9CB